MHKPDKYRLHPIPVESYEALGGIEKKPLPVLVLSWMYGGQAYYGREIETPKGSLFLDEGQVWGSRDSMIEDIYAATGRRFTYAQMRYATEKLATEKLGASTLVSDLGNAFPSTRGKYGKVYEINRFESHRLVNVAKAYTMFYYGDPREFVLSEIVTSDDISNDDYNKRNIKRRFGNAQAFAEFCAKNSFPREAFTSIGRWQKGRQKQDDAPVLVPWFTIDIDRDVILDAVEDTRQIVQGLLQLGYPQDRIFVSFSGQKGFHIQIASSVFGNPIFGSAQAALDVVGAVLGEISEEFGIEFDPSAYSPLKLIRLTGSVHGKSNLRKRTWTAPNFARMSTTEIFEAMTAPFESFDLVNPLMGKVEDSILEDFLTVSDKVAKQRMKIERSIKKQGARYHRNAKSSVIDSLSQGVGEGEVWHPKHCGRNDATFVLSCWQLERMSESEAYEFVSEWNQLNSPPLRTKEIDRVFNNALKRINQK